MRPSKCEPRPGGQQLERLGLREGEGRYGTGVRHAVVHVGNGEGSDRSAGCARLRGRQGSPEPSHRSWWAARRRRSGGRRGRHRQEAGRSRSWCGGAPPPTRLRRAGPTLVRIASDTESLPRSWSKPAHRSASRSFPRRAEPDDGRPEACDRPSVSGGVPRWYAVKSRTSKAKEEVGMPQQEWRASGCPNRAPSRPHGASRSLLKGLCRVAGPGARLPFSRRDGIPRGS